MKYLAILLTLIGCATAPKEDSKYKNCTYPSVICSPGCELRDKRLKPVEDFCMPIDLIKVLDLRGYE